MKKVNYINPETGKKESIKIKPKKEKETYSKPTKLIVILIILLLVVPIFITAIWYLINL